MPFRDTASFGKRQEFVAIAELLHRGFDVYATLVDDRQIDCVIRNEVDGRPAYLDIQIKARSKQCAPKNAGRFAAMDIPNPRHNYFFIFYSEQVDAYWVVPSLDLVAHASRNRSGQNEGRYSIDLTRLYRKTGQVVPRPKFDTYRGNFDLLKEYQG